MNEPKTAPKPPSQPDAKEESSFTIDQITNSASARKHSIIKREFVREPVRVPDSSPSTSAAKPQRQVKITVKGVALRECHEKLIEWTPKLIEGTRDPIGKGIMALTSQGPLSALYLKANEETALTALPTFISNACFQSDETRRGLWNGFHWDPHITPEAWKNFIEHGVLEFGPPGSFTNIESNRNVLRMAFGARSDETLVIVRCGTSQKCRGVIALFTQHKLKLADALAYFFEPNSWRKPAPSKKAA